MKKFITNFLAVIFVLSIASIAIAKEITITFDWQANTEPTMAGYALFERKDNGAYDYTKPIDPTCTIVAGECWVDPTNKNNEFSTKVNIDLPAISGFTASYDKVNKVISFSWPTTALGSTTYSWVARATDGELWSGDSNEVSLTFDLTITNWKIFKSTTSGSGYQPVLDVTWDGTSTDISATLPADTLAPGSVYYFTVVGYTADGIFTADSNEVQIDRRPPTKVINLKIKLVQ